MGIRRQLHITQGFPLTGRKAQRIAAASVAGTDMPEKTPAETLAGVGEGEDK